ncbi:MAG: hypothetical protein ABI359_07570 [Ginsengibacter sp.]
MYSGFYSYSWFCFSTWAFHIHMIIGSNKNKLEDIVRDIKSFTSTGLRKSITENIEESRKEWMIWIACPDFSGFERTGKKNGNNDGWSRKHSGVTT